MTTFKDDFAALLNVTAVQAVVSERIFPGRAKQGCARPYIVWRRNGGDPMATLNGASLNRSKRDMIVGCYADTYDQAADLADLVFAALAAGSTQCKVIPRPPADGFDPDTRLDVSVVEASVSHRPS